MGSSHGEAESRTAGSTGFDRPTALLAAGDAAVVTGVLLVGELTHDVAILANLTRVSKLVAAFLLGWFLLAGLLGLYDGRSWELWPSLRTTTAAWLGAANVGLLLRGSPLLAGGTTWPFPLVITGLVLLALLAWRLAVVGVVTSRSG
jgi:hypothetical protein